MNYAIMSVNLDSYYLTRMSYREAEQWYEEHRESIVEEPSKSNYSGARLVKMKRVKSGCRVDLKLWTKGMEWSPRWEWRYSKYLCWLFFRIGFEFNYSDVVDKVIKDFYEEIRAKGGHTNDD